MAPARTASKPNRGGIGRDCAARDTDRVLCRPCTPARRGSVLLLDRTTRIATPRHATPDLVEAPAAGGVRELVVPMRGRRDMVPTPVLAVLSLRRAFRPTAHRPNRSSTRHTPIGAKSSHLGRRESPSFCETKIPPSIEPHGRPPPCARSCKQNSTIGSAGTRPYSGVHPGSAGTRTYSGAPSRGTPRITSKPARALPVSTAR